MNQPFTNGMMQIADEPLRVNNRRLAGKLIRKPGHKIWSLHLPDATISEAPLIGKEIDIKPLHLYCSALNKKSAERRFIKMLQQKSHRNPSRVMK